MRILCLTVGPDSEPSSRFRVHQWIGPLRAQGIEVEVRPRADRAYLELGYGLRALPAPLRALRMAAQLGRVLVLRLRDLWDGRRYDAVWLQKETLPFGLAALASRLGLRLVFDFDDAIHLRAELAHGGGDAGARALRRLADTLLRRERALPRLLARCAVVLGGSPNLVAYARSHARDVRLLPTVVDVDAYPVQPVRLTGPLTIGWIGAPPNAVYLEPLRPVFQRLARRFDLRLRLHGPSAWSCPGVAVECRPWRHYASAADEAADLHGLDVGIMPLRDDAFAAGKCALKAIQYMAAGVPVVASPVGVNAEVLGQGACGLLASSPAEWEAALARLLEDAELRARLGRAGRRRAEERYSLRAALPGLARALEDAAAEPTAPARAGGSGAARPERERAARRSARGPHGFVVEPSGIEGVVPVSTSAKIREVGREVASGTRSLSGPSLSAEREAFFATSRRRMWLLLEVAAGRIPARDVERVWGVPPGILAAWREEMFISEAEAQGLAPADVPKPDPQATNGSHSGDLR